MSESTDRITEITLAEQEGFSRRQVRAEYPISVVRHLSSGIRHRSSGRRRSRPALARLRHFDPVRVDDADHVAAGQLRAGVAEAFQGGQHGGCTGGAADDYGRMEFRQPGYHQARPAGRGAPARRVAGNAGCFTAAFGRRTGDRLGRIRVAAPGRRSLGLGKGDADRRGAGLGEHGQKRGDGSEEHGESHAPRLAARRAVMNPARAQWRIS